MKRLQIGILGALGFEMAMAHPAYSQCVPQSETLIPIQYTDSGGFHDFLVHTYTDPDCPIDYYSTTKEDQYEIGSVMPTFHFTPEAIGGPDGIAIGFVKDWDFSNLDEITGLSIRGQNYPYNATIIATNGYNDLNNKGTPQNVSDVKSARRN